MADRQKHSDMFKEKVVLWQLRLDGHIDDFEEAFDRFSDETEDVATGFCTGVLSDFYRFNCRLQFSFFSETFVLIAVDPW